MNVFCTFLLRLFQTFCIFSFHTHMHWTEFEPRAKRVFKKIKITAQWTDPDILNIFFPHRTVYKRDICKFVFKWKDVCVQYHFKIWGRLWMKKDKSSFSRDTVLYKQYHYLTYTALVHDIWPNVTFNYFCIISYTQLSSVIIWWVVLCRAAVYNSYFTSHFTWKTF